MIAADYSFEKYASIRAVSNTGLGKIARSPAHYQAWIGSDLEDESDALRVGRIAHRAILEPDKFIAEFDSVYAVKGSGMKFSTKEGKEWKQLQELNGKTIIAADEYCFLQAAVKQIAAHKTASKMLRDGRAELSVWAEIEGVPAKCRVDFDTRGNSLVDLKTARDASPKGFQRAIVDRAYYRQAAFYLDVCAAAGLEKKHFCFLAIEKEPPYLLGCYRLDEQAIHQGRMEYRRLLELYKACSEKNDWPGYSDRLEEIGLPMWAIKETQDPAWVSEPLAA